MAKVTHTTELVVAGKDQSGPALSAMDKLMAKAKALRREERASGESALKSILRGGGAGLSDFALDAMGGGMVGIGIHMAGRAANAGLEKWQEIRKEMQAGRQTMAGAADELAKTLPIYGEIWRFGRRIREEWDGTADAIAENVRWVKELKTDLDAQMAIGSMRRKARVGNRETIIGQAEGIFGLGLEGRRADEFRLENSINRRARLLPDQQKAIQDEVAKLYNARIEPMAARQRELADKKSEAQAKVDALKNTTPLEMANTILFAARVKGAYEGKKVLDELAASKEDVNLGKQLAGVVAERDTEIARQQRVAAAKAKLGNILDQAAFDIARAQGNAPSMMLQGPATESGGRLMTGVAESYRDSTTAYNQRQVELLQQIVDAIRANAEQQAKLVIAEIKPSLN